MFQIDSHQLSLVRSNRRRAEKLYTDGNLVGSPILQLDESTEMVTIWFATDQGSLVTLVSGKSGDHEDRLHEVASGYFEVSL